MLVSYNRFAIPGPWASKYSKFDDRGGRTVAQQASGARKYESMYCAPLCYGYLTVEQERAITGQCSSFTGYYWYGWLSAMLWSGSFLAQYYLAGGDTQPRNYSTFWQAHLRFTCNVCNA